MGDRKQAKPSKAPRRAPARPSAAVSHSREDQRRHPRLEPVGLSVELGSQTRLHLIDISTTGVSFYSDAPFPRGQRLSTPVDGAGVLEAEVVHCTRDDSMRQPDEPCYRLRCRLISAASA